ncbi:cytochrome P450 [Penicillium chermesinum]|uniref:Cytochrome P450 n=1 Tax=Penicillium chermesinum TaxID=63820 RepID=A0A9W9TT27_9EURO|nr:cytochrome P450 [Penicillium chermesinum]KAJ5238509.1 cytochrome P450 [Penicillium chermesinum]
MALLALYRLYWSPIAHIPGPRLAALTGWYETFFDVFQGGQFTFQIEAWHQQYGPIIRINPWEVHISDPDFYNQLYTATAKYKKPEDWRFRFGLENSTFDTIDHDHHHRRRGPLGTFFARSKILEFSAYIQQQTDRMVNRLQDEYRGQVVCLNEAWGALTMDIITFYAFGLSYNFLDYPDFKAPFTTAIQHLARSLHVAGHFPFLLTALKALPDSLVAILSPTMKPVFQFHEACSEIAVQIRHVTSGQNDRHKTVAHKTVFHEILHSNLDPIELLPDRLKHDGASIVGAGVDTTKTTLSVACYHILANPDIHARLREELEAAMPVPAAPLSLTELECLPYLTAVTKEHPNFGTALRLAIGIAQRLRRINPSAPIQYGSYTIPPNTVFGMSSYLQLRDARIFPEPDTFLPDRWLGEPVAPNGRALGQYLVPFGRGPRMCLGMNMAQAEIYIGLAAVFRRLDLELWETGREAVDMAREFFVPMAADGTKGVRVVVK